MDPIKRKKLAEPLAGYRDVSATYVSRTRDDVDDALRLEVSRFSKLSEVEVNLNIGAILESRSGLALKSSRPPFWDKFIRQTEHVSSAIRTGEASVVIEYFPQDFDREVELSHSSLVARIKNELGET